MSGMEVSFLFVCFFRGEVEKNNDHVSDITQLIKNMYKHKSLGDKLKRAEGRMK